MPRIRSWGPLTSLTIVVGLLVGGIASRAATLGIRQSSQRTFALAGRVIDGVTGAPVTGATVQVQTPAGGIQATSDSTGRFVLKPLQAGAYRVTAKALGYVPRMLAQTRPESAAEVVDVGSGQPITEVEIRLWKLAVIAGRVVSQSGKPIAGVWVHALRAVEFDGPPTARDPIAKTDDRGEYRIGDVAPGAWMVGVRFATITESQTTARQSLSTGSAIGSASRTLRIGDSLIRLSDTSAAAPAAVGMKDGLLIVRPTTYYPSALGTADAVFLSIGPGDLRDGVDVLVSEEPSHFVSGTVNSPASVATPVVLSLRRTDNDESIITGALDLAWTEMIAPGRFKLAGVPPGQYVLNVEESSGPSVGSARPGRRTVSSGSLLINVGNVDVEDVAVTLKQGLTVRGKVVWEDPAPELTRAPTVVLNGRWPSASFMGQGPSVNADLSTGSEFVASGLHPGLYTFHVTAPPPWRVAWIELGGRRIGARPLRVDVDTSLTLIMTRRFGTVRATLRDVRTPRSAVRFLLFPSDRTAWSGSSLDTMRFRDLSDMALQSGTFVDVPAGDYFVTAVPEQMFDARWRRLDKLGSLAVGAVHIAVSAGTVPVSVPVAGGG